MYVVRFEVLVRDVFYYELGDVLFDVLNHIYDSFYDIYHDLFFYQMNDENGYVLQVYDVLFCDEDGQSCDVCDGYFYGVFSIF